MSLPIPSSLIARTAGDLAGQVAKRIGKVMEFADVLAKSPSATEQPADAESGSNETAAELRGRLIESIQRVLQESGIQLNQSLDLSVLPDGSLRVETEHGRAAEIEARLRDDAELRELAKSWTAAVQRNSERPGDLGPTPIRLTIPSPTASILPVPGGYPNW